jgi:DegV family protein with EDD domain
VISIGYLDGRRLSRAVIAGARFVSDRAEALNRINVLSGARRRHRHQLRFDAVQDSRRSRADPAAPRARAVAALAEEAVGGARGNSGAILAQFFCGFADGLPDRPRVSAAEFGGAVVRAADSAYQAIARPVEGTILTVIRDWARHVAARSAEVVDFEKLLPESLERAKEALEATPRQMQALRKAGVVDAGAQGFVYLLEGIVRYLREAARGAVPEAPPVEIAAAVFDKTPEEILFRFCTEALLEGDDIDRDALRREAALLGDSIVIAGGATRVRLHVHTNEPEKVFQTVARFAEVAQTKVEDMRAQHETRFDQNRAQRVGVVTDSTCDLPQTLFEELSIGMVPVRVYFGSENYLDKVTITPAEFYARFAVTEDNPKTSQPPPADFTQVYATSRRTPARSFRSTCPRRSPARIRRRSSAPAGVEKTRFLHVDSRNVSVGLGLVVRAAAEAAAAGKDADEVERVARDAADRTRAFVAVPTLEHLVRGGRVSPLKGLFARLLGLLPVLTISSEGKVYSGAKARGFEAARRKLMRLLFEAADAGRGGERRFAVAHCDSAELAERLARQIRERYPESDVLIAECGPALGAHGGPGAVAVAVLA